MTRQRRDSIVALLKGIETGDPDSIKVVNEDQYIQHNPQTHEGGEGLAQLFKRLALTSPRVNIVRIFSDGDFVFGHTEYDFSSSRVGFEVFRFEGEQTVEHWDNIQARLGPNHSNRSMVDGSIEVSDLSKTETNRKRIAEFVETVLLKRQTSELGKFIAPNLIEHNPHSADGLAKLQCHLESKDEQGQTVIEYQKLHRLLAQGNFVLSICEGVHNQQHSAYYDLFRLENEMIVEHWDTTEKIAAKSEWQNNNGKF